jgi:hypothetical protein
LQSWLRHYFGNMCSWFRRWFSMQKAVNILSVCVVHARWELSSYKKSTVQVIKCLQSLILHFCKLQHNPLIWHPQNWKGARLSNILAHQQPSLTECALVRCSQFIADRFSFFNYRRPINRVSFRKLCCKPLYNILCNSANLGLFQYLVLEMALHTSTQCHKQP